MLGQKQAFFNLFPYFFNYLIVLLIFKVALINNNNNYEHLTSSNTSGTKNFEFKNWSRD